MQVLIDITKKFKELFLIQSKSVVKVFKYIHFMSRKYHSVFLCLDTIARATGFCKRQVQRAIEKLINLGWLGKMIRKRQSSIFFVPDEIKKLDISNKKIFENSTPENPFFEEKCPLNVHPSIKSYLGNESLDRKKGDFSDRRDKKEVHIPKSLNMRSLDDEERYRLAKNFSEYEIQEGIYRMKRACMAAGDTVGTSIRSVCAYLFTACRSVRLETKARA